jgi:hypothetical protein
MPQNCPCFFSNLCYTSFCKVLRLSNAADLSAAFFIFGTPRPLFS